MTNLLSAILTYFNASTSGPLSGQITGGLHLEEAPPGTLMPYCVMNVISATSTTRYGAVAFSEPQIQFTVFGTGAATTLALLDNSSTGLIAKMDEHAFSLTGSTNVYTRRLHDPVPIADMPMPDQSDVPVFGWSVTYAFANN